MCDNRAMRSVCASALESSSRDARSRELLERRASLLILSSPPPPDASGLPFFRERCALFTSRRLLFTDCSLVFHLCCARVSSAALERTGGGLRSRGSAHLTPARTCLLCAALHFQLHYNYNYTAGETPAKTLVPSARRSRLVSAHVLCTALPQRPQSRSMGVRASRSLLLPPEKYSNLSLTCFPSENTTQQLILQRVSHTHSLM